MPVTRISTDLDGPAGLPTGYVEQTVRTGSTPLETLNVTSRVERRDIVYTPARLVASFREVFPSRRRHPDARAHAPNSRRACGADSVSGILRSPPQEGKEAITPGQP